MTVKELQERATTGLEGARRAAGRRVGDLDKRTRKLRKRAGKKVAGARRRVGYAIAGGEPRSNRLGIAALGVATGAVLAFFLDPENGKRRRHVARDRVLSLIRGGREGLARRGRYLAGKVEGFRHEVRAQDVVTIPENDATLAHKVESEVPPGGRGTE